MDPSFALPWEMFEHVFSFLPAQDLVRASSASTRWHYLANTDSVWKNAIGNQLGVRFLDTATRGTFAPQITTWKECFRILHSLRMDFAPARDRFDQSLGCPHYTRKCKLFAACCNRFVTCRHCHDAEAYDHRIDRYATKLVLCMVCRTIQPVAAECKSNGCSDARFASYFCVICKFYNEDPLRPSFHCHSCGVCKLGERGSSFHCHSCGSCFRDTHKHTHPCFSRATLIHS
jgi:hypothetical protein